MSPTDRRSLVRTSVVPAIVAGVIVLAGAGRPAPMFARSEDSAQTSPLPIYLPVALRRFEPVDRPSATPGPSPTSSAPGPGHLLLNEVRFKPAEGQTPFVELVNVGPGASAGGVITLTNARTETYRLPDSLPALGPHTPLLILFDGRGRVEGRTIHADRTSFVDPMSDVISLTDARGAVVDRVAWGEHQAGSVNLSRGGRVPDLVPGTTIGRFPMSTAVDPLEWVTYAPAQASPGAANPQPDVEVLLPLSGAMLDGAHVQLSWYLVAGAVQYRVEIATDESFSSPLIDQTMPEPPLAAGTLAPGGYFWRVQAIGADGSTAEFSPVSWFGVRSAAFYARLAATSSVSKTLAVPLFYQHKDTGMLLLESRNETGVHAWDVDHGTLDADDPADNTNCALASVAMVTAYSGGRLSQDRIGFELRKGKKAGPEWDLNYALGLTDAQTTSSLAFALGAAPTYRPDPEWADFLWTDVTNEIDAGRPIVATSPNHVFVIVGYSTGGDKQFVVINDPWYGSYQVNFARRLWDSYWLLPAVTQPRSDEPEIRLDSDGDGVVDFDETERFQTDPNNQDTDSDKIKDKDDVRLSVFDPDHGYGHSGDARDDIDGDGKPPELDNDADNGGCFDGFEDLNQNGKIDKGEDETSPFDKSDDRCISGTYRSHNDQTTPLGNGDGTLRSWEDQAADFSLAPVAGGTMKGEGLYGFHVGSRTEWFGPDQPCHLWEQPTTGVDWLSDLTGTLKDKTVTIDPGGPSPTFTITTIECGVTTTGEYPPVKWQGAGCDLVDGTCDIRYDFPPTPPSTGEYYILIHIEQWGAKH